jgi:hypothetical protein
LAIFAEKLPNLFLVHFVTKESLHIWHPSEEINLFNPYLMNFLFWAPQSWKEKHFYNLDLIIILTIQIQLLGIDSKKKSTPATARGAGGGGGGILPPTSSKQATNSGFNPGVQVQHIQTFKNGTKYVL